MNKPTKFNARFCRDHLGAFPTLAEAQAAITAHPIYRKSKFTNNSTGKADHEKTFPENTKNIS